MNSKKWCKTTCRLLVINSGSPKSAGLHRYWLISLRASTGPYAQGRLAVALMYWLNYSHSPHKGSREGYKVNASETERVWSCCWRDATQQTLWWKKTSIFSLSKHPPTCRVSHLCCLLSTLDGIVQFRPPNGHIFLSVSCLYINKCAVLLMSVAVKGPWVAGVPISC